MARTRPCTMTSTSHVTEKITAAPITTLKMASTLLLNESNVSDLIQRNKATIIQHMNLPLLAPALVKHHLLDWTQPIPSENSIASSTEFLNMVINKGGSAHVQFARSVKASHCHLGHQYITSILEGREFARKEVISLSTEYQEALENIMTDMMDIDLPCLIPHMLESSILTQGEANLLLHQDELGTTKKMRLFQIFRSKGPTAHYLFVQSLRKEKQHPPHQELWEKICQQEQLQCPSPKRKTPRELMVQEPLTGHEYLKIRLCFECAYHSEKWDEVRKLFEECLQKKRLEIQAFGYLEHALSWIFRVDEQQTVYYINLAKQVIEKIPCDNDNRTFLEGRCEYLLALLYLYLGQLQKAKRHVKNALSILYITEVGEDKSFACYVDAKVSAAELSSTPTPDQLQKVIRLFMFALEYAEHSENLDILVIYSLLRLCELYLHTTIQALGTSPQANPSDLTPAEQENIQRARDCLESLKTKYYDSMDLRCKCIYKLAECDLYRCSGRVDDAIQSAKSARRLIHRDSKYKHELTRVRETLKTLTCT